MLIVVIVIGLLYARSAERHHEGAVIKIFP